MNAEFNQHQIYFVLDTVTYHQNDDWFYNIEDTGDDVEAEMRSATYIDPVHYYNIWTVNLNGTGAGGWNQFGSWNAESSYWQGATVHYTQSGGGLTNHTIIHEAGHHLELMHTFQYGCGSPGDGVMIPLRRRTMIVTLAVLLLTLVHMTQVQILLETI